MLPFGTNALRNAFNVQEMQRWTSGAMPARPTVATSTSTSATSSESTSTTMPTAAAAAATATAAASTTLPLPTPTSSAVAIASNTINTGSVYMRTPEGILVPNRIFVGGISPDTTEDELRRVFSSYGSVRSTRIIVDQLGISKGYGFVTFETEQDVNLLLTGGELYLLKNLNWNIAPAIKRDRNLLNQSNIYNNSNNNSNTSNNSSSMPSYTNHAAVVAAAAAAATRFDQHPTSPSTSTGRPLNAVPGFGRYTSPQRYPCYMMTPMSSPTLPATAMSPSSLSQYFRSQQLR